MKNTLIRLLILGGVYFIVSLLLNLTGRQVFSMLAGILYFTLIIYAIICLFKKNPDGFITSMDKLHEKFPKASIYLIALGWLPYFSLPFVILMLVIVAQLAMSDSVEITASNVYVLKIIFLFSKAYLLLLLTSLVVATVIVLKKFIKERKDLKAN